MKVVTSGLVFLDIDAYAGCVAYAELLNLQGFEAVAYSSATMNGSIPQSIKSWETPFSSSYTPTDDDSFILIDVSEPDYLDKVVELSRVEEVIDHHLGNEKYWEQRIGQKANIEFVGAACTQIYEYWQKAGLIDQMSETSARLLISGILDNTLNFKAQVTTNRDHVAYKKLWEIANLPDGWSAQYFKECEESIFEDIVSALLNDSKNMKFPNSDLLEVYVGQLAIWDAGRVIDQYRTTIEVAMSDKSKDWLVNIINIKNGESIFLASNSAVVSWLGKTLELEFKNELAVADRLWLRKEIMKQSILLA